MTDDNMLSCITNLAISVMIHAERGKVLQSNAGTVCISSSHKYQEYPQLLYCNDQSSLLRTVLPTHFYQVQAFLSPQMCGGVEA